ncbi:hypothetical protein [Burkholderia ubonensis]|uniref:hypothetical protein n=1 Tax=Burkholderia ubonensis TaxID=101571 RepID=UPI0012BA9F70|nr:hypothetical protein [Burkholderia ubonensis]
MLKSPLGLARHATAAHVTTSAFGFPAALAAVPPVDAYHRTHYQYENPQTHCHFSGYGWQNV